MNETSLKELATIDVTEMRTIGHVSVKAYVSYLKTKFLLIKHTFMDSNKLLMVDAGRLIINIKMIINNQM
ncbi:putative multidrug resistance-associated protein lethal(2)03659 isoform X1 [Vespula squamosa]|uniref:Multidrug resistance-associated protein lethal(2)03659 isoform X1 n=1 Tax=Vespula squamosa TaxID=30214 RepID=A0ABD2BAI5_VESSQ